MSRHPIRDISPVLGVPWEVVARIAFLSPVRQWSNANGRGHVMNAKLVDAEEILASSASLTPVEDDDSIEHVYYAFTTIRDFAHADVHAQADILPMIMDVGVLDSVVDRKDGVQVKRELKLTDSSNVEIVCTLWNEFAEVDYTPAEWFDDTRGGFSVPISLVDCNVTSLKDVASHPEGTSVSVIGVTKDGRILRKRTVALQDMSDTDVECTLWLAEVDKVTSEQPESVLSLENAKVVIYGDCRVATSVKTLDLVDPAIPACFELVRWYTTPPNVSADDDDKGNKSTMTADQEKQSTSPKQLQVATDAALEHSLRGSIGNVEPATLRSHSPQATPSPIAADDPGTSNKKPKKREPKGG
ncbi:hypothetical protein PHYSODRAFT_306620 [Phytophthora sojae]|uniref:Replication protein A OB domain-containing protein n=1 Tax=Phytophthora sojae (strain P6497) TaxID=1094619 RepID=G5AA19_PHYSP|nr:hypothetical protein PHYSODRAFT_306620 [Phytophthora sojae]EGZ07448.1 hypothetical protein PHYSODRAFT_306620 [Phytophthora sojae]|eukprot:XP_009537014.1 hypothetical protein PHYSODRAFT_306620 [Phytophthora sojae]